MIWTKRDEATAASASIVVTVMLDVIFFHRFPFHIISFNCYTAKPNEYISTIIELIQCNSLHYKAAYLHRSYLCR